MDVHRDFCEVAISEGGKARLAGRVKAQPAALELFAQSLGGDDRVVLEATGNAVAIARILAPHVSEVVLAHSRKVRAIAEAKVKTDAVDACTLAELLAADLVPRVWVGDERTRLLRRLVSRRRQLVKQSTRTKNEISAVLLRNLKGKPPMTDIFGTAGRAWLATLELGIDERETVDAGLRQLDFVRAEIGRVDQTIAEQAIGWPEIRRLMTIPGVDVTTAAALMAAIGDIARFPTPRHLVGYLGLDPRLRQSGVAKPRRGRISKEGSAAARHALTEAAWSATRGPGPLRAFAERVGARRGRHVAAVAVARKLVVLAWHLLTRGEDYAYQRPTLVRRKLRRLELMTGAPHAKRQPGPTTPRRTQRQLEADLARQAELAYRRLVTDWQRSKPQPQASDEGAVASGT
ncbi:MAG: IS110 family transposase [Chloroflexota bacterium]|nr:IS110 family transposase [Chloroflexota bacterium]